MYDISSPILIKKYVCLMNIFSKVTGYITF
nr:MAG TPA: Prodomain subtilisin 2 [Caudoviricetes sp.]